MILDCWEVTALPGHSFTPQASAECLPGPAFTLVSGTVVRKTDTRSPASRLSYSGWERSSHKRHQ